MHKHYENLGKNAANYVPLSPLSFLSRTADLFPDREAVIYGNVSYSWSDIQRRAHQLASALSKRGIGLGDTVAVLSPNTPAMFDALAICAMAPASAAGPFPTIDRMERREIHEGEPGEPLRLGIRVVDGECAPVPGAVVDIWHCDATGDYSEYIDDGSGKDEGEGSTFCRGLQRADSDGIVEFLSIYPGWYEGRAVHIHVTVIVDDAAVRSCLMLAVQADGTTIRTIEGLATDGVWHPVQQGMHDHHGFQCAFCSPGFMMTAVAMLEADPERHEQEIREELGGNLCRCTGYESIIDGVLAAVATLRQEAR